MKSIALIAPRPNDDPVRFDTYVGEPLYRIFNKPGVNRITTTDGVVIERAPNE
jgi:hypothetical protein